MSNPVLSDRRFEAATDPHLERPSPGLVDAQAMSYGGTVRAIAVLLAIVLAGAAFGWSTVEAGSIPGWFVPLLLGALAVAIVTAFRPQIARFTGPIYAAAEGVVLGVITHVFEFEFEGIALQALLATAATFLVMLVLWATRTIRVTERLRSTVVGATLGILAFYVISIVMSFFGVEAPLVWDSGPLGILFSAVVVVIAAFNLLLDFDVIERGVTGEAPRYMEWYAAFGLVVTIVWLYLEILRLLAKVRD